MSPSSLPSVLPTVLVVPARPDARGRRAAAQAVDLLAGLADARVAAPGTDRAGLADLLPTADHVVVLDPGHWRAAFTDHPVLGAAARAHDRLVLIRLLRAYPCRVRWVGDPRQWDALCALLRARATTTTAVRT